MKKRLITGLSLVLPIALCIISCNGNPVATDTIQNSPDINTAIVRKVFIDEFQDVRPSEPVISFIDISRIKAEACIPEETASMLRRAGTDKVKVCFETIRGKTFTPDKIYITQGSSQNNISFILTAVIPNPKSVLSGGMSGKISISGNGEESPLAIPQKALCHDAQNNDFVWVINKDGNPELRKVTAGDLVKGGNIIVVSGLKEGEEIVTEGKYRLPDNSRQH